MTEYRWLTCDDPEPMMTFLLRWPHSRKLRLFACACCRRVWNLLTDERSRQAVVVAERYADNLVPAAERAAIEAEATLAGFEAVTREERVAAESARWAVAVEVPVRRVAENTLPFHFYPDYHLRSGQRFEKEAQQARLLHDIFGNPFRPATVNPAWLTSDVVALARGIYAERAFDRMPILADALQDAGCNNDDILNHCRDTSLTHVRGCWVIDLLTGRG